MGLPNDLRLLILEEAGMTHQEIADKYNVTRQAVTYRLNAMGKYKRGPRADVTACLPWDLSAPELKRKLWNQQPFLGLRALVRERLGRDLSARSELALRAFLNRVRSGEVLAVSEERGAHYVPRDPVRDGSLVIRWPDGLPRDDRAALFDLPPGATDEEAGQKAASGC